MDRYLEQYIEKEGCEALPKRRDYTRSRIDLCRNCGGEGLADRCRCNVCGGTGRVRKTICVSVTVEAYGKGE